MLPSMIQLFIQNQHPCLTTQAPLGCSADGTNIDTTLTILVGVYV